MRLELPDREEPLGRQPQPGGGQLAALSSPLVEKTQLELPIAFPDTLGLPHSARSVSHGHAVSKL